MPLKEGFRSPSKVNCAPVDLLWLTTPLPLDRKMDGKVRFDFIERSSHI